MVVYLARHVVYLNRIVVTGMGNIGMSNIGMSTGAYGNVKSPDFPLHHMFIKIKLKLKRSFKIFIF